MLPTRRLLGLHALIRCAGLTFGVPNGRDGTTVKVPFLPWSGEEHRRFVQAMRMFAPSTYPDPTRPPPQGQTNAAAPAQFVSNVSSPGHRTSIRWRLESQMDHPSLPTHARRSRQQAQRSACATATTTSARVGEYRQHYLRCVDMHGIVPAATSGPNTASGSGNG